MKDEIFLRKLGEKIVEIRTKKGISQLSLAEKIGSSNVQVRRIERGEVNSSIIMLRKIAREIGVTLSELVAASG